MTIVALGSAAPRRRNSRKLAGAVALSLLASGSAMAAMNITIIDLRSIMAALMKSLPVVLAKLPVQVKPTTGGKPVQPAPAPTPTPPAATSAPLGINLGGINYWDGVRVLMNLSQGGGWALMQSGVMGAHDFPAAQVDGKGTVLWLGADQWAEKILVPPEGAYGASAVRVRCTWAGQGELVAKYAAANISRGANSLEFDWQPANGSKPQQVSLAISRTNSSDPLRQVDCREASASQTATFSPQFLELLSGYKLVRFMDWQATNTNAPITWATRVTPDAEYQSSSKGMAVEHMVTLANETGSDAWFTVPWNADEDYVRRFATYVRDNLAPGRKVYVEVGNEVWNWGFPVTHQARDEGLAEGLSTDQTEAFLWRYAEKSTWAFKIWTDVFKASPDRLVRVMAFQNGSTWGVDKALQFRDTKQYVDAIASAPYFGGDTFGDARAGISDLNNIFAYLSADIDRTLSLAVSMKAQAKAMGKRYIAYEGGQHLVNAANPDLAASVNRDPRMYDMYRKYLSAWKTQTGEVMTLFNSHSAFSRYGAWGLREYSGQSLGATPKLRAARDFISSGQ